MSGQVTKNKVHFIRWVTLYGFKELGISADLQQGTGFYLPGQLGVLNFITVSAQITGNRNAPQKVSIAQPPSIGERPLVNDVYPRPHRLDGGLGGGSLTLWPKSSSYFDDA
jgi:hypothetical protein